MNIAGGFIFEIVRGCYRLPQSGRLANDLLHKKINKEGYFEASTTPGLRRHKWRPIQFMIIVNHFGVEYVGRKHSENLTSVLKKHHEISEDREGNIFPGIDLIWDYEQKHSDRTCRLSMASYIAKILFKVGNKLLVKKQLLPHHCREITYGIKVQQALEEDSSPTLDEK